MNTIIHKMKFDDEGLYDEVYLFNGQEITGTQFIGIESDLKNVEDFEYGAEEYCADCDCTECEEVEKNNTNTLNIKANVSLNQDDLKNIFDTIVYLEKRLKNIGINFSF